MAVAAAAPCAAASCRRLQLPPRALRGAAVAPPPPARSSPSFTPPPPLGKPKLRFVGAAGGEHLGWTISRRNGWARPVSRRLARSRAALGRRLRARSSLAPDTPSSAPPLPLPPATRAAAAGLQDGISALKPALMAAALEGGQPPPPPISRSDEAFLADLGVEFVWGAEGVDVEELNGLFEKVGTGSCDAVDGPAWCM